MKKGEEIQDYDDIKICLGELINITQKQRQIAENRQHPEFFFFCGKTGENASVKKEVS